jgi:hypothetical protein
MLIKLRGIQPVKIFFTLQEPSTCLRMSSLDRHLTCIDLFELQRSKASLYLHFFKIETGLKLSNVTIRALQALCTRESSRFVT